MRSEWRMIWPREKSVYVDKIDKGNNPNVFRLSDSWRLSNLRHSLKSRRAIILQRESYCFCWERAADVQLLSLRPAVRKTRKGRPGSGNGKRQNSDSDIITLRAPDPVLAERNLAPHEYSHTVKCKWLIIIIPDVVLMFYERHGFIYRLRCLLIKLLC